LQFQNLSKNLPGGWQTFFSQYVCYRTETLSVADNIVGFHVVIPAFMGGWKRGKRSGNHDK
jgi:hypothetical protein